MGKRHCTSGYVSQVHAFVADKSTFMADFRAEMDFLNILPTLPVGKSLRDIFHPEPFQVLTALCTAPHQQNNGYEGPLVVLLDRNDRHYVITREDEPSHLCLQIGEAAHMRKMFGQHGVVCFGATPHVFSGPAAEVMITLKKDILTSGLIHLPPEGALRDAWEDAVLSYKTSQMNNAHLALRVALPQNDRHLCRQLTLSGHND